MTDQQKIIADLEKLALTETIDVVGFFDPTKEFEYEPIGHYLNSIKNQSKPETASNELFRQVIKDVLKMEPYGEVYIGTGFIDFTIKESIGNPLLIELKPLFKLNKTKGEIRREELFYEEHENQILKYLKNNEYVVLTNLKDAFLFSRNAIIEFEPFAILSFTELIKNFIQFGNLWDTIRRIEDENVKIDLDKTFFEDLKNWYNEFKTVKFIENDKYSKEELIVLLLNKIIFIKTLEDFGLIQFKHLTDEYLNKKDKWEAKGSERILTTFFKEMEEYFDYFYDTELFKTKFWDYVDKDKENLDKFQNIFETALGLDAWHHTFGRGMIHYNYRQIDEDIFGKAYETFIAENKKDTGVYYTPKQITQYMSKKLVDYLFKELVEDIVRLVNKDNPNYERANELLQQLYEIKIIDPASGSGSFLIKVLREIYNYYKKIDDATKWVVSISGANLFDLPSSYQDTVDFRIQHNFNDHLKLISKIILRHIHAVDFDERALETAKTNIWKEAIKLNPRIYNYKKLNGQSSHILPDLELNFVCADSLADLEIDEQIKFLSSNHKQEIKLLHELRHKYLSDPFNPQNVDEALKIRERIYKVMKDKLIEIDNPLFVCLRYFFVYFDKDGNPPDENKKGFDGVISNPPWETIKPIEKEFAQKSKYGMNVIDFKKWFKDKLENDKDFSENWMKYKQFYRNYTAFLSIRFKHQGMGDLNFYKLFIERGIELLRSEGEMNILVPSGIQTDLGCSKLRDLLIRTLTLKELTSFENRGYKIKRGEEEATVKLFPDVDNRFKFTILRLNNSRINISDIIASKFYLHDPDDLMKDNFIPYTVEMIERFSPQNLSLMEFRDVKDYAMCKKIRGEHKLLGDCGYNFTSELHMTNDSHLFVGKDIIKSEKELREYLPLFEGKMIHQFNSEFSGYRYLVSKKQAYELLLSTERNRLKRELELEDSEIDTMRIKLDCESYRLAYRAVASSTNERSIISSILPPDVLIGHSMNYLVNHLYKKSKGKVIQQEVPPEDLIILMSLLNSLVLNYYIRNKISANLTINFMYELPMPKIKKRDIGKIKLLGTTLLSLNDNKSLFNALIKKLGISVSKKADPIQLRAELEVFIAKELFKLNREDWEYITSTFVYGEKSETKQELDRFIKRSLEIF